MYDVRAEFFYYDHEIDGLTIFEKVWNFPGYRGSSFSLENTKKVSNF